MLHFSGPCRVLYPISPAPFPVLPTPCPRPRLALGVLREEESSDATGKPLCPHAQSVSSLCTSCLHCVTLRAGSVFSMVPKPVPAGCTESHQQLICWLTAGGFVCAALAGRAAGWPGHGTHQATPAFLGAAAGSALASATLVGPRDSHRAARGLGTALTQSPAEAQCQGPAQWDGERQGLICPQNTAQRGLV